MPTHLGRASVCLEELNSDLQVAKSHLTSLLPGESLRQFPLRDIDHIRVTASSYWRGGGLIFRHLLTTSQHPELSKHTHTQANVNTIRAVGLLPRVDNNNKLTFTLPSPQ